MQSAADAKHAFVKDWVVANPGVAAAILMAVLVVVVIIVMGYLFKTLFMHLGMLIAPKMYESHLAKKVKDAEAAEAAFAAAMAAKKKKSTFDAGVPDFANPQGTFNVNWGNGQRAAFQSDYHGQAAFYTPQDMQQSTVQLQMNPYAAGKAQSTGVDGCPAGTSLQSVYDPATNSVRMKCASGQNCEEPRDEDADYENLGHLLKSQ